MNKYKAGNPIQNVYQDTLISRVANYKNKTTGGHLSEVAAAANNDNDETNMTEPPQEQLTMGKKKEYLHFKKKQL